MQHLVVGKPRAGKGMLVCGEHWEHSMYNQVTKTDRFIVHNMKLYEDEWQELLDSRGFNIHFRARTLQLTDEQMRDFWLYREFGVVLPRCEDYDNSKAETHVDYTPIFTDPRFRVGGKLNNDDGSETPMRGTAYFFDEIHNVYPSRQWHNTPRHFTFYTSQHGKLNDSFVASTQAIKNCDPVVYRIAQDFTYCRNNRLEKFGRFKRGSGFQAKTYSDPRTQEGQVPNSVLDYKFDPKIGALYDTSAGIGMPGGGTADKGHSVKGIPMNAVWVVIGLAICGVYWFMNYQMPKLTRHFMVGVVAPNSATKTPEKGGIVDTPKSAENLAAVPRSQNSSSERTLQSARSPDLVVTVRGYVIRGGKTNVILSDGRVLTEDDRELERITRNGVVVDGKKLYMLTPSLSLDRRPALALTSGSVPSVPSEDEARSREAKISSTEQTSMVNAPKKSDMSVFDSSRVPPPGRSSKVSPTTTGKTVFPR